MHRAGSKNFSSSGICRRGRALSKVCRLSSVDCWGAYKKIFLWRNGMRRKTFPRRKCIFFSICIDVGARCERDILGIVDAWEVF